MVRKFIAHGEAQPIRLAIMTDDIQTTDFRLFARILGKRRQRKRLAGTHDNAAVAFIEPLRLHTGLPWNPLAVFVSLAFSLGTALVFYRLMLKFLPA